MRNRIKLWLDTNAAIKRLVLVLLMPTGQAKPRWWVRVFVNRFFHSYGKGSLICRRTRMDVLPFNGFSLGSNSTVEDFATINNGLGSVEIGNSVRVGIGSVVIGPVQIGDNVIIAQNAVLSAMNHGYELPNVPIREQACTFSQISVGEDSWIGANVVITAGIKIGKHAVIAAGSVVTKNVPDYTIVAGVPAKAIKQYNFEIGIWEKVA